MRPGLAIYRTEVLGHTVRVIDAQGNDVVVVGDVSDPAAVERAQRLAERLTAEQWLAAGTHLKERP